MKNNLPLYVANAVLLAAVIVLFVLYAGLRKGASGQQPRAMAAYDSTAVLPIAYVSMDTLLMNSTMYHRYSEELLKMEENSRLNINQKANALQAEMLDFQKKIENRIYATEERARSEQERLLRKQRELQELDASLAQELILKRDSMTMKMKLSIDSVINIFNASGKYAFILSDTSGDNILYGDKAYNVTEEVLQMLNGTKK